MDKMAGNETGKKKPKLLGFGKVLLRNWVLIGAINLHVRCTANFL